MLAYTELLPRDLDFTAEWAGPNNEAMQQSSGSAKKHTSEVWIAFPGLSLPTPGLWRVALHIQKSAPGGSAVLAWRNFLVLDQTGKIHDQIAQQARDYFDVSESMPRV